MKLNFKDGNMKVWVLVLGTGGLYKIGYRGGFACYVSKRKAEKMVQAIDSHDFEYIKHREGLFVKSVEADEDVLNALRLYIYEENND